MHSHSDFTLLTNPTSDSKVRQGVTTELIAHCGFSAAPMTDRSIGSLKAILGENEQLAIDWQSYEEYVEKVRQTGVSVNVAGMIGHGTVRMAVMGYEARKPSDAELAAMRALVKEAMEAGSFGISTGLTYTPGSYSETEEIIALAEVASACGGTYYTHMRSESRGLMASIREAIRIGREAHLPVQISHIKCAGAARGSSKEVIDLIESARREGIEITADQYPYLAGATNLAAVLPPWAHAGGQEALIERLNDPTERARMKQDMQGTLPGWDNDFGTVTMADVLIVGCKDTALEGKFVQEIADERGQDPYDTIFDLLGKVDIGTAMVIFMMTEDDVRYMMAQETVMIGTDAAGIAPWMDGKTHPRSYGTYARVLGQYVRDEKAISLAQAVFKMTGFPAAKLGLQDRGLLKEGFWADITIFDPETVADQASYTDPHQFPTGIPHVLVNGEFVVRDGHHTGARPGQFLTRQ